MVLEYEKQSMENLVVLFEVEMQDLFEKWGPRKIRLPFLGENQYFLCYMDTPEEIKLVYA